MTAESESESAHYLLPTDPDEVDRLNAQHRATTLLFKGHLPSEIITRIDDTVSSGQRFRVLDSGCGTGIWAMELAVKYPGVHITGVDINPMWPKGIPVPDNIRFEQRNILHDIPVEHRAAYDLVHCRFLITAIRDFPALLKQLGRLLKPGGYLVLTEPELACVSLEHHVKLEESCPFMARLGEISRTAMQSLGVEVDAVQMMPLYLGESGIFTNVKSETKHLPMSPWSTDPRLHEIGKIQLINSLSMPTAIKRLVLSSGLIESKEMARLTDGYQNELTTMKGRPALPLWRVWATKI
ncbi:hypothetical protein IAT40_001952 [Kwoniella sp. CBS 6097]